MVIWLFAGGGEAEIRGLVPFLQKHFANCRFDRMTPAIRKPGPRPGKSLSGYGKTGKSLVAEIRERLSEALSKGDKCDIILVMDDLDCRDCNRQRKIFENAVKSAGNCDDIDIFIGFAAPELESWIIADWDHSVGEHSDFRGKRYQRMRHWLVTEKKIPFDAPEAFGTYNAQRDCCDSKLSEAIIESSMIHKDDENLPRYSKAYHTPLLLQKMRPDTVKSKCPIFRQMFNFLDEKCNT
ncbi:MAG: DUF4276 family protein [Desulfococcaceae bacterium]